MFTPMGIDARFVEWPALPQGTSILTFTDTPNEDQMAEVCEAAIRWQIFCQAKRVGDIDEFPFAQTLVEYYTRDLRFIDLATIIEPTFLQVAASGVVKTIVNPEWENARFYGRFAYQKTKPGVAIWYEGNKTAMALDKSDTEFLIQIRPRVRVP